MKYFFYLLFLFYILNSSISDGYAQTDHQRNLLSGRFHQADLLKIYQNLTGWKPFPEYNDRKAWTALPETVKSAHLEAAEKALEYTWPVLQATLYLEYARNGNRSNYHSVDF
jgi:hypothetical protein